MRFRLGINQASGAAPYAGIGNAFRNMAMMPMLQAQAAEEAQNEQAKRSLQAAQQRQAEAHAALFGAQADAERTQVERGSVPSLIAATALKNGIPLHQVGEATQFYQTGQLEPRYELPGSTQGPTMPRPAYADPTIGDRLYRELGLTLHGQAIGDKNLENFGKAQGLRQQQDDIRRVQADPSLAGQVGQSYAAAEGKPLVQNIASTGRGFNQFTGSGVDIHPGMAALYDQGERAEIGQRNAAAAASYAAGRNSDAGARHHDASTGKIQLETQQLRDGQGKGSMSSPKDKFDAENKLRDEFQKQSQTFGKVRDAFSKVVAATQNPNAASDIALIFAYMKMLDPDSVVREGEFATAQNAGGVPDRIVNMYNRAINGTRLNDVQRKNFTNEAKKVYDAQSTGLKQTEKNYGELAGRYGLDVRNIVTPFAPVEVGTVGGGKVVDFGSLGGGAPAGAPPKVIDFGGMR